MSVPPEPPALAHIERTLAEAYRKEIDQEENIWRSLPFFAATLALQLAALFQLVDRLPPLDGWGGRLALGFLGLSALATLVALCFLAACIYPRKFQYLAPDPELLAYAKGLLQDEQEQPDAGQFSALNTLKEALARQYAQGAQHNRQINKLRERLRSIAGLATVLSVVLTLLLVATTFLYYIPHPPQEGRGHAQPTVRSGPDRVLDPAGERDQPGRPEASGREATPGAGDAGGHQGLVDPARGTRQR